MRIVGGKYRGRVFNPDKRFTARPTTDLAKEGLFNILSNRYDFSEMNVLDLFSGTGSIGYEFLSRHAGEVTFVEKNKHHILFIRKILAQLEATNVKIVLDDVFRFLKNCPFRFDIAFADPPYEFLFIKEVLHAVFESGILNENGLFILEHSKSFDFSQNPQFMEIRRYGKVQFSFFKAHNSVLNQ